MISVNIKGKVMAASRLMVRRRIRLPFTWLPPLVPTVLTEGLEASPEQPARLCSSQEWPDRSLTHPEVTGLWRYLVYASLSGPSLLMQVQIDLDLGRGENTWIGETKHTILQSVLQ